MGSVGAWRKLAPADDTSTDAEILQRRNLSGATRIPTRSDFGMRSIAPLKLPFAVPARRAMPKHRLSLRARRFPAPAPAERQKDDLSVRPREDPRDGLRRDRRHVHGIPPPAGGVNAGTATALMAGYGWRTRCRPSPAISSSRACNGWRPPATRSFYMRMTKLRRSAGGFRFA